MSTKEIFWFDDITILYNTNYLLKYFPSNDMSLSEILNSLVRLSFYISIILIILKKNINYSFICIFTLAMTYLIYSNLSDDDKKELEQFNNYEKFNKENFIKPTKENPFMNVLQEDYENNVDRVAENEAELYNNDNYEKVQDVIEDNFSSNLFQDMTDIYNNRNSQRQYYTMPNTQIPNDQTSFAKWCYSTPTTCKEGNSLQCYDNLPPVFGDPGLRGKSQNV
tara:strand:- start:3422 stop:4090 length:669 start_codon:yes stop_codon:yes gene_type:complete